MQGHFRSVLSWLLLGLTAAHAGGSQAVPGAPSFHVGKLLYRDDFRHGLGSWVVEMERAGTVAAKNGVLDIDVPEGATMWFRPELHGPVMIQYEATVIAAGGPNDRVSDLNSFWMARDPKAPQNLFAHMRSGKFTDYNALELYYVGLGGNGNTTTRFRRYIGSDAVRPLLPGNDLSVAQQHEVGIVPNKPQTITLIANGTLIQYWRDHRKVFEMRDPSPYTDGWFGIRTTKNHMQVRRLRVFRLAATAP